jgi:hypothetical protein
MKNRGIIPAAIFLRILLLLLSFTFRAESQDDDHHVTAYEDYAREMLSTDETYLSTLEEWQDIIDQWLENPLCINSAEADWLIDYRIINLYQLNKLKEYRLIYGDLLSVYELSFIDGWDFLTVRKVIPLVTTLISSKDRTFKQFNPRFLRQGLIFKTAVNTEKSKGYDKAGSEDDENEKPVYLGSPVRMSLRYDLDYRNKLVFGLRMEKDPGEPILIPSTLISKKIKTPDMLSGFLQVNDLGPFSSIIAGNYRVSFGYGVNLSGGQSGFGGGNGMAGMANRIRPKTSISEAGFFRGIAINAGLGRFSITGFASLQKIDGTSLVTDSLGRPQSFSSVDVSGLHRTISELNSRKSIGEKIFGGFLVYSNNWMKTGVIALYNEFDASLVNGTQAYKLFGFSGTSNLVTGFSSTIWLPKVHLFNETSISKNKKTAIVSGLELLPAPGVQISIAHSHFAVAYQNMYGSGSVSSSRNSGENGLNVDIRVELPKKWLVELVSGISRSLWASYTIKGPSIEKEIRVLAEKAWPQATSMSFSFRYLQNSVTDPHLSTWICHPEDRSEYKFRLEGRFEADARFRFKTRVECGFSLENIKTIDPGWMLFQDIEYSLSVMDLKFWLRACIFDVPDYESRIYAYENDVLYDFTSAMLYGKGVKGIIMLTCSPADWLDLWLRLSTVYYTNKQIGSGYDEIDGNRQNEIEIQLRIKIPG